MTTEDSALSPSTLAPNLTERADIVELAQVLEAVLFAAPEPLTLDALRKGLGANAARLEAALGRLAADLHDGNRGLRVQRHEATVQLVTAPALAPDLERFFGYQATQRLSPAAL